MNINARSEQNMFCKLSGRLFYREEAQTKLHDSKWLLQSLHPWLSSQSNLWWIVIVIRRYWNNCVLSFPSCTMLWFFKISPLSTGRIQQCDPGNLLRNAKVSSSGWVMRWGLAPGRRGESSATSPSIHTNSPHWSGRGIVSPSSCFLPWQCFTVQCPILCTF